MKFHDSTWSVHLGLAMPQNNYFNSSINFKPKTNFYETEKSTVRFFSLPTMGANLFN